ncbi:MAG TPA: pantoate--beta-alanine ligase [Anaerolineales bacterium]|nr:pantoate--beta-alanine ligase [Anaerolineales bacterium]
MKTTTTLDELHAALKKLPTPVGLVATMGFLHEGHLSLARRAGDENESVVATIFVNPTQFGPGEDLDAYPRNMMGDLAKLESEGVDLVWHPAKEDVYPAGFQTTVTVSQLSRRLEGEHRPGHFEGVATVVAKLFNIVRPDRAYFGQKDAQQAAVIKRMVRDLNFPVEIVICPTVRESDGLAMSSRNNYLSDIQRAAAPVLYRALSVARSAYEDGQRDGKALRELMLETLAEETLADPQYVSCADPQTLEELHKVEDDMLLSMAVVVGKTRLIDNFLLEGGEWVGE